jgi:signal transduction histidine kinase
MVVPIAAAGGAGRQGVLACARLAAPAFSAHDLELARELAHHLALQRRAHRLESESLRVGDRLHRLAACAAQAVAAPDLQTAAQHLCDATRAIFGTTRSALFLLEEKDLVPHAVAGPYGERAVGGTLHIPPGVEPAFDEAVRDGEVIVMNRFRESRFVETPIPVPFRPQAAMVIPLRDQGGVFGLLTASELENPDQFVPRDADDARLLGAIAAVAVRKSLLVDDLQRASAAKSDFLADMSHELRTPLNVLLGYTQLLGEGTFGPLNAEQGEVLARMERSATSQLVLVTDLLDIARIEQGRLSVAFEPVSVSAVAAALKEMMGALLRNRPVRLELSIAPDAIAWTDAKRLQQILLNLLSNASKFTQEGVIRLTAERHGDVVEVEVSDTGCGIEAALKGRVVEPFVHGASPAAGVGLGLAIVTRLLRVLEGGLTIDSEPGRGTTVRVRVPAMEPVKLAPSVRLN